MQLELALAAGGMLAALLIFVAFLLYNWKDGRINTGTWVVLAFGDSLDFGSYFEMTDRDLVKNAVPLCFAIGSIVTFLFALWKRRFALPSGLDIFVILLDVVIMFWWLRTDQGTATGANLAYQATGLLAFVPMYWGIIKGTERETPLPWALWTIANAIFLLTHLIGDGSWEEGVYPLVAVITHAAVLRLALRAQRALHP